MTKSEFKQDLLRGLGRCVQAVQSEPERYRECVLWACSHEIAYDPQCEGSRAYYVYDMVACYPEREPFIAAAVEALGKAKAGSWKLSYLAELCGLFARDSSEAAEAALWAKYEVIYAAFSARHRPSRAAMDELFTLDSIAVLLARDSRTRLRLCADIGALYAAGCPCDGWDFTWFYDVRVRRARRSIEKAALRNEDIRAFLAEADRVEEEMARPHSRRKFQKFEKELPDAEAVFSTLRSGVTDPDELHGLVRELFDLEDAGVKVPAELLLQAYESGYCSCCRETTVRILARRRLLTEDILHECLYDSDDEIRAYARRLLARRHQ